MTDQLMRCPFCEERARIKQLPFCPEDIKSKKWVVGCDGKNGILCPGYIWKCAPFYVTRDQAVEYWNHRAPVAKADNGWISVNDRLPEDEGDVLVYGVSPRGRKKTAIMNYLAFEADRPRWALDGIWTVLYWMPIPEPPREEGAKE